MNKKHLIFIVITLLMTAISYIALDNYYVPVAVFLVYLIIPFVFFVPSLMKYEKNLKQFHECYHFINNFIISLSIKKSVAGALETTVNSMPSEFIDMYSGLENMNDSEKLNYLSTYFHFHDYQLFLQIIDLWQEEGGDILMMSKYLISDIRNNEEYISKVDDMGKRKYFEIGILWAICLMIVVFLRFALKDFYEKVKTQIIFIAAIGLLTLFILFTIYLLIKKATKIELKGFDYHEENV